MRLCLVLRLRSARPKDAAAEERIGGGAGRSQASGRPLRHGHAGGGPCLSRCCGAAFVGRSSRQQRVCSLPLEAGRRRSLGLRRRSWLVQSQLAALLEGAELGIGGYAAAGPTAAQCRTRVRRASAWCCGCGRQDRGRRCRRADWGRRWQEPSQWPPAAPWARGWRPVPVAWLRGSLWGAAAGSSTRPAIGRGQAAQFGAEAAELVGAEPAGRLARRHGVGDGRISSAAPSRRSQRRGHSRLCLYPRRRSDSQYHE